MSEDQSLDKPANSQDALANLPGIPKDDLDFRDSVKLPLDAIPALGTAFASLPEVFRTATTTIATKSQGGAPLFWLTDAAGNIISPDMLQKFKDGSGLLASMRTNGTFAQARLHVANAVSSTQTVTAVVPFDPTSMFLAAAVMQINQKLDAIANMQKEMFAYAKLCKHSELVGACNTLKEIQRTYRFNNDNQQYLLTRGVEVRNAKGVAQNAIVMQRELINSKMVRLKTIHTSAEVNKKADEILEAFREYQLASYLYAYATVVDVVLTGNFSQEYLGDIVNELEDHARSYENLFHKCLGSIKKDARKALGSRILNRMGAGGRAVGNFVGSTIIGDLTPIDEALISGSAALSSKARNGVRRNKAVLSTAKPGFTKPFVDSIRKMNEMHNEPMVMAISEDSVYVMPATNLDLKHARGTASRETASRSHATPDAHGRSRRDSHYHSSQTNSKAHHRVQRDANQRKPQSSKLGELQAFLNEDGRLTALPQERTLRLVALWYLADKLAETRFYTEPELNAEIDSWLLTKDHATARRELVDSGLLFRFPDGSTYGLADELPPLDRFVTANMHSRRR